MLPARLRRGAGALFRLPMDIPSPLGFFASASCRSSRSWLFCIFVALSSDQNYSFDFCSSFNERLITRAGSLRISVAEGRISGLGCRQISIRPQFKFERQAGDAWLQS